MYDLLKGLRVVEGSAFVAAPTCGLYLAQMEPPRQHYVRLDLATGRRERDTQPELRGREVSLRGLDGFFAARMRRVA